MNDLKDLTNLATGLRNSNIPEVSNLATGFLQLVSNYENLLHRHTKLTADQMMEKHAKLLARLGADDTGEL